ncbi:ribosomal protein S18-alanine N-acetyltransferase [Pseudoalteromonas ruthenica]|uniref:ribosomal protein S18-alanine N-acetyltransferase n=1 Tax=Pseudoalteromonas ruthenica TaxID=151081 RepID=UPI00110A0D34|nr:ribosomal protein S18-alanine N-acetyltransferase [Pseudoalteromonas ruthenica]TMO45752.1 ribosomal-protein-alanine N-acetyltransferase [Pseudoalteromonas ruthenica]TMO50778.1 ribosomal-protein-alanine N-acetyltransferase [Pseudoalteromonas ruthenica]TMO89498.1 ribosomal-protein-alanine N-acetyltransferase [Pseudoalteromonas ruthenica]TMP22541.1 ribosomal-protein-alanine N-acetyltransferase [Pseudoalteromonas ruthenica]
MQVSELSLDHIQAVCVIENACHSHPWSEKLIRSCLGGRYFNAGLYDEAELVGFYIAEQAGPDCTLMDICIVPNKQGQGLSKALMNHLINQATARQCEAIFLEVRASNDAATGLYQRSGFVINGRRKKYYPDGEDALLMMRELDVAQS